MAIRSGFFNSVNGDRKYDANRFAEYFATFIGNGVFPNPSTNLQVVSNDDMTVTVRAGKAWINGYVLINDDDYILTLEPADGVLSRIDRIVARYDTTDREIRLEVRQGNFASSPVPQSLQRDADAYELGLADVLVSNGAISITQSNITDLRQSSEYCGIVHGTVDQVDVTTLYNQYTEGFELKKSEFEQEFMTWFQTLQDVLDENTATNLFNMITTTNDNLSDLSGEFDVHLAEKATLSELGHIEHGVLTTTLNTTWTGSEAPFTKVQTVTGITSTDTPILDIVMSGTLETDEARQEAWGNVYRATTANNTITFYATKKPTVSLPIQLKVVR